MPSSTENKQPVRSSGPVVLSAELDVLAADVQELATRHDLFAELHRRNGVPPLWRRTPSFETLVRLILEQQVSLASANATYARLEERVSTVSPEGILASSDADLRADGFSRQKTSYVRGLAIQMLNGELSEHDLRSDQASIGPRLLEIRGVGPWTVACYLLFATGARDIWPVGDRALHVSMARNLGLDSVPGSHVAAETAAPWEPFRSAAARMLWYDYLGGRTHIPARNAGFVDGTGKIPL